MVDTLRTAHSFGLRGEKVDLQYQGFDVNAVVAAGDDEAQASAAHFLSMLQGWMELTGVLNELTRSMGVADFYPFVLSVQAVRKLHFVHRVIADFALGGQPQSKTGPQACC
jgi:hypothetical protein